MYKLLLSMTLAFLLVACEKEKRPAPNATEKSFTLSGFNRIHAGETYNITVKQGATFAVVAKGRSEDLDDLVATVEQGNILSVRYNGFKQGRYRVDIEITLPQVTGIHLIGAATGRVEGFGQSTTNLNVVLSEMARCTVKQLPLLVNTSLSANSELTLIGTSGDLIANLLANAKLNAYEATFDDADVYTAAQSVARVKVVKSLAAFASENSRIYYKGSPASFNAEESGTARVIKE
jgi:hypothetical protein